MLSPTTAMIAVGSMLTVSCTTADYALTGDAIGTCTDPGDGTGAVFSPDISTTTCGKFVVLLIMCV